MNNILVTHGRPGTTDTSISFMYHTITLTLHTGWTRIINNFIVICYSQYSIVFGFNLEEVIR